MAEETRKDIIVSIQTDATEAAQGVDKFKEKLDTINEVDVNKSIKTLKNDLKEATNEAQRMFKEFGSGSKEFKDASTKVASLKNDIDEVNLSIQNFNPDNKLQALVSLGRAGVGALQGVAGAMAFVGVESEDAMKTMARLQGLMAFGDALNSLGDLKDTWNNINSLIGKSTILKKADTIVTNLASGAMRLFGLSTVATGTAFKALKVAIASTGIGLLIVGIGLLVEKVSSLTSATDDATSSQEKLNEAQKKFLDNLDSKGLMEKIELETAEFNLKRLKAQGASDDAIYKQQQEVFKRQQELSGKRIKAMVAFGVDDDKLKAEQDKRDGAREGSILAADERETKRRTDAIQKQKEHNAKAKAEQDKKDAEEKSSLDQHLKELDEVQKAAIKANVIRGQNEREAEISGIQEDYKNRVSLLEKTRAEELNILNKNYKKGNVTVEQFNKQKIDLERKYNDVGIDLSIDYQGHKLEIEKKYHDMILNYVNEQTQSDFEQKRATIVKEFDDLIEVADNKEKEVLEKLKNKKLDEADTEETLRKNTINSETNLTITETENIISDDDSPDDRRTKIENIRLAELEAEAAAFELKREQLRGQKEELAQLEAEHNSKIVGINREAHDAKKALDEEERQRKIQTYQLIGNAAVSLGELFGKQTVAAKALNVANALMNTYTGITEIWRAKSVLPEPFGTAAKVASTIVAATSGFSAVKNILSTKVPGGGGGAGGSAPSVAGTAPIINAAQTSAATSAIQDVRVTNREDQVVHAYVLEKDLRTQQEKTNFANKLSSF